MCSSVGEKPWLVNEGLGYVMGLEKMVNGIWGGCGRVGDKLFPRAFGWMDSSVRLRPGAQSGPWSLGLMGLVR